MGRDVAPQFLVAVVGRIAPLQGTLVARRSGKNVAERVAVKSSRLLSSPLFCRAPRRHHGEPRERLMGSS